MRTILFSVLFVSFMSACNDGDKKPKPEKLNGQPNSLINSSIDSMMNAYYNLSEAFVKWDSAIVPINSKILQDKLLTLKLDELRKDTGVTNSVPQLMEKILKSNAVISGNADLITKRHSFNTLTENLYQLLNNIKYNENKLYLQECPMAFNDTEPGVWLTGKGKDSIRNPYLGLFHPKYGSAMLVCGGNKATIDFQK